MAIKIHESLITPENPSSHCKRWRVYGTRKALYAGGNLSALPGSWELVTEFELKQSGRKVGFPSFELEPTDEGEWVFYSLVPVDESGREIWHEGEELSLPRDLPEAFERLDVATWMLWNLERRGVIAPGQI